MGGKGKRRHQNVSNQGSGKKQKQAAGKNKDDGAEGTAIVLTRTKKISSSSSSNYPIPGLMNLGNTCFFNSVMQNLAQTHYLVQRLQELLSVDQTKLVLPSPRESLPPLLVTVDSKPGKFAQDFHGFLGEMRNRAKHPLNPRIVFSHVCKNVPRFSSYQQQDSQELLRYLLDALRNEEVHRIKRAILEVYNVKGRATEKMSITEQEKKAIKAYGIQATIAPTFVEDVFGGKLVSSVTCQECDTCYEIQEDFLDLSLPVPADTSKASFSSRAFAKSKQKVPCHSSEDAEGDDEWEGTNDSKRRSKEDPRLSKHQQKQKRREERKRSKMKQRFSLDQFNKQTYLGEDLKKISQECKSSFESLPVVRSASEITFDNQDSCLADDEVTFQSTQQDSDSSALFMQSMNTRGEGVPPPPESSEDNQPQVQNFTAEEDDKPDTTSWNDREQTVDTITDHVGSMSLHDGHQQNLSESLVAMFESQESSVKKEVDPMCQEMENDADNQTTDNKTPRGSVVYEEDAVEVGSPQAADGEWVPEFGPCSRKESITNVTTRLQNIETRDDPTAISEVSGPVGNKEKAPVDTSESVKTEENSSAGSNPEPRTALTGEKPAESSAESEPPPKHLSKPDPSEVNKFCLESCLHQFTSPEYLTGTEKFCCETCTKNHQSQNEKCETKKSEPHILVCVTECTEDGLEKKACQLVVRNTKSEEAATPAENQEKIDEDQLTALVEQEEVLPVERSTSSTSSSISAEENTKDEDEDTEMLESTKESDDMDEDRGSSSELGEAVFCDAIKQMLIDKPPAVLCLHLKRFIQQGRNFKNMRKNNCYIAFPLLLDIIPYSTEHCKELFSVDGQLLYSLYGVVVHGGGMHGGHYTAFVRVRNELQLKYLLTVEDALIKPTSSAEDPPLPRTDAAGPQEGITESTRIVPEASPPVDDNTTVEQNSESVSIKFDAGVETRSTNVGGATDPKVPRSSSIPINDGNGQEAHHQTDVHVDHTSNINHHFDFSSLGGQWYHISDSHVKKSSESDVLKSEAYLLFYERLPPNNKIPRLILNV